jgi:predicted RNA binding protein YcfA (HicA-like mRNA interferase family)
VSKRQKRLERLRQNPRDVSFEELRQVLVAEGFELDHATGSHHVFRAEAGKEILTVVVPFSRPVKTVYVKQALEAIDKLRQATEAEEEVENDGTDTS